MIVSDIVTLDKKRQKIYMDNEFAFVLYKGELHLYQIEIGNEITDTVYETIKAVLLKRAKLRAMNLLMKRDYTEMQLRNKLQEGYYQDEIIEQTILYLKSYGYIDDERYVRSYFALHISSKPKRFIIQKLLELGVSKDLIEKLIDDIYEKERSLTYVPDELEIGRNLLKKRKYRIWESINERQKAYGYLLRKGISPDNAMKLVKECQKQEGTT